MTSSLKFCKIRLLTVSLYILHTDDNSEFYKWAEITRTRTRTRAHIRAHAHARTHTRTRAHKHTHTYTYTYAQTHARIHIRTCVYTYTHTRTHAQTRLLMITSHRNNSSSLVHFGAPYKYCPKIHKVHDRSLRMISTVTLSRD